MNKQSASTALEESPSSRAAASPHNELLMRFPLSGQLISISPDMRFQRTGIFTPLRERPEDIAIMINHTINKYSSLLQKEINGIDKNALNILLSYSWPGNIREIENVIEYAINMEASNIISISSLPDKLVKGKDIYLTNEKTSLKSQLNIAERAIINNCLDVTGCSLEGKRKAADILEISESTLYRKLRNLGIKR